MNVPFLIPFLKGFMRFSKAPITWCIVYLNIVVYIMTGTNTSTVTEGWSDLVKDKQVLKVQGRLYMDFINNHPEQYEGVVKQFAQRARDGEVHLIKQLASFSFTDKLFISVATKGLVASDAVAYGWWQKQFLEQKNKFSELPRNVLSVKGVGPNLISWVTYQFVHADIIHLLINMIFVLIFGAYLERFLGSFRFLMVYLFSGFIAAGVFLTFNDITLAPLMGASGSLSGVMAFLCIILWKRPIKFFYILMIPIRRYMGVVKLPAWVAFALLIINDLSGFLSKPQMFVEVAYSAHLGGAFIGTVLAVLYIAVKRAERSRVLVAQKIHKL